MRVCAGRGLGLGWQHYSGRLCLAGCDLLLLLFKPGQALVRCSSGWSAVSRCCKGVVPGRNGGPEGWTLDLFLAKLAQIGIFVFLGRGERNGNEHEKQRQSSFHGSSYSPALFKQLCCHSPSPKRHRKVIWTKLLDLCESLPTDPKTAQRMFILVTVVFSWFLESRSLDSSSPTGSRQVAAGGALRFH